MVVILIFFASLPILYFVFAIALRAGKFHYALGTLKRLMKAYNTGDISETQFKVMMNELVDPHDFPAVKSVSDWLDEINEGS